MNLFQAIESDVQKDGGSFFPIQCDLTQRDQIYAMFDTIKTQYSGVDVCINNAGLAFSSSLLDGTPEEWQRSVDVSSFPFILGALYIRFKLYKEGKEGQ